ncbi:MAG TPA: DNA-processing protein DprA [bacterium]|nr:DNA-processing protein DprA [bacterium]
MTVVSGLARGIDIVYPPEHARLAEQIARAGALLSEYPPGTPPLRHQFPRRNRLISGLALGVVIVEGREDSGALITADCALEQGREGFAVPGPLFAPTSDLPHRLVQQGAKLIRRVEDILEDLRLPQPAQLAPQIATALEGAEAAVYAQLSWDPLHVDILVRRCGLPVAVVGQALVGLELRGLARALAGQRYVRAVPGG